MSRGLRIALWLAALVQAALAAGYVFEVPAAVDLWPVADRGQLTNVFIGSFFAAAAASLAWCLALRSLRALAAVAADYVVLLSLFAVASFVRATGRGDTSRAHLIAFGLVSLGGAVAAGLVLRYGLRARWRDPRPTPPLVRWSFGLFVVGLALVAALLLARVKVLPWPVTDELSTLIGCMFLGSAAFFGYGFVQPRWENAGAQLAGFLAYDLVLIGPFLDHFSKVPDEFRLNLIVYTVVLVCSGLLAAYYLFLHPVTRGRAPASAERNATVEAMPAGRSAGS